LPPVRGSKSATGRRPRSALYFERWPKQEANFRAVNRALGLKEVHGYGKQLVDNVTVVTELDELGQKILRGQERVEQGTVELKRQREVLHQQQKLRGRWQRRHETLARQLHARVGGGQRITPKLRQLAAEHKAADQQVSKRTQQVSRSDLKMVRLNTQLQRQQRLLEQHQERQAMLESRRHIFQARR
jgi:hypothetical protein